MEFKQIENPFWMVWVHGGGKPVKRCRSLEEAKEDAIRLRNEVTKRHVYILQGVEMLEGRAVIEFKKKGLQKENDTSSI